jgi:hypothetical protein
VNARARLLTAGFARALKPLLLVAFALFSTAALATVYSFSGTVGGSNYPACSGGSWSVSGTTYTCAGSISLASGDSIVAASSISVVANAGITLVGNNTIGSSTVAVNLASTYGNISVSGTSNIYGALSSQSGSIAVSGTTLSGNITSSTGAITLTNSTLTGNITSSGGNVTLTSSTVSGTVTTGGKLTTSGGSVSGNVSANNGVSSTNSTVFGAAVSAANGAISLSGGSVAGALSSSCCTITATNVSIGGNVSTTVISSTNNTITLIGCTVAGTISSSGGNGVVITSSTVTSGSITTTNVPITITNSTIGSSANQVNVTSNNTVTITNSTVYGSVTAGNWSSALTIDSSSIIYGICTSDNNSVTVPTQYPRCAGASGSKVAQFNACHNYSSSACSTSAARLYTQRSATAFTTDIVALKSDGTVDTSFTGKATISVIAKTATGATLDSQNCFTADATQTINSATSAFVAGRLTLTATIPTAYQDVRFKIVCDSTNCSSSSSGISACSSDDFAVRPGSFSSISAAAANADASGASTTATPVVKAGAAFTLTATAGAGYNGTPKVSSSLVSAHSGAVRTGVVSATFGAASAATGVATASGATYNEVGYFKFAVDGVYDDSFTYVDQANGDCITGYSNTADSGKIGCAFGNTAATDYFGRFIPDHFAVATPSFTPGCVNSDTTKSFSYMDQPFTLSAAVEAQSASNDKTQNYQGSFANGTVSVQIENADSGVALADTRLAGRGTPAWSAGSYPFVATQFSRLSSGPDGSYEALDIGLSVTDESALAATLRPYLLVRDMDAASATCTADSTGLLTTAGVCTAKKIVSAAKMRYGRLRLNSGQGSGQASYVVKSEAQYWDGAYWRTNVQDSCTSYAPANAKISGSTGTTVSAASGVSNGYGSLTLSKPTSLGVATICLDTASTDNGCVAASPASIGYLLGNWKTATSYDRDPSATVRFGGANADSRGNWGFLYRRENF